MKRSKDNRIDSILAYIFIFCFIFFCLWCCASVEVRGQNVVRKGNTFIEQPTDTASRPKAKKTDYVYVEKDGQAYPVWVSSKGKYFIIKVSKRSGKEYRKYLPELTKMLTKK